MRLAIKLAAGFVLGISVILLLYGVSRVRQAAELVENDTHQDHAAIGQTLASTVAEVWRVDGRSDALALVDLINREKTQISIRWVSLTGPPTDPDRPRLGAHELRQVAAGEPQFIIKSEGRGRTLYSYIPVEIAGTTRAAIELSESLDRGQEYISGIIVRQLLTAGVIAVFCAGMALALGYLMVGKPVRLLVGMARRVGRGDFSGRVELRQRDELGHLASEMNVMIRRLSQTSDELAAETCSRLAALEQLRHADRLKTVGQLASGIAHELGTPLQVISGRGKMLVRGMPSAEEARESAAVIVEQAERITRIIRQLLDFARRRSPQKSRHDLVAAVERTIALLQPMALGQGVQLELAGPGHPIELEIDLAQIQQVLTNVLVNAIQSMARGGTARVVIEERHRRPPADLEGEEGQFICIEVVDQGTGIAPSVLPRVFEPFFTTKQVGDGTGLGLSVSYGIVREHGGWFEVASEECKGSCFTICLPQRAPGDQPAPSP